MLRTASHQLWRRAIHLLCLAVLIHQPGNRLLHASGQRSSGRPVGGSCAILVAQAEARKKRTEKGNQGEIGFRVSNSGCPSGGENVVTVGIAPLDITGTLGIKSYEPSSSLDVPVPASGMVSSEQTIVFDVSGAGTIKFQVSITQCNGESCTDLNWEVTRNHLQTNEVRFP